MFSDAKGKELAKSVSLLRGRMKKREGNELREGESNLTKPNFALAPKQSR